MGSFLQKVAEIEGFPTGDKIAKHVHLSHLPRGLLLDRTKAPPRRAAMTPRPAPEAEDDSPAPRPPRPDGRGHGGIRGELDPLTPLPDLIGG